MEEKLQHRLYKLELHWIKMIPIVISILTLLHTLLSYLNIDTVIISYIIGLLVWLFLYLSSFVFKFCLYHRLFLYYILVVNCINCYDYSYTIPISLRPMIAIQIGIAGIFLFSILYSYKHDKSRIKKRISKIAEGIH